jgi:hypothetical protein
MHSASTSLRQNGDLPAWSISPCTMAVYVLSVLLGCLLDEVRQLMVGGLCWNAVPAWIPDSS